MINPLHVLKPNTYIQILKPKYFLSLKWKFDDFFIHFDRGYKKTKGEKKFLFKVYTKVECF